VRRQDNKSFVLTTEQKMEIMMEKPSWMMVPSSMVGPQFPKGPMLLVRDKRATYGSAVYQFFGYHSRLPSPIGV
jgi:hypothetical protein